MNGLRKAVTIIECWNTINLTNEIQPMKFKYVSNLMRLGVAANSLPNVWTYLLLITTNNFMGPNRFAITPEHLETKVVVLFIFYIKTFSTYSFYKKYVFFLFSFRFFFSKTDKKLYCYLKTTKFIIW